MADTPLALAGAAYAITGAAVGLGAGLPLAGGTYAITGAAVVLGRGFRLDKGSYRIATAAGDGRVKLLVNGVEGDQGAWWYYHHS